jgi:hypothetical protein
LARKLNVKMPSDQTPKTFFICPRRRSTELDRQSMAEVDLDANAVGHTRGMAAEALAPGIARSIRILIASEIFGVEVFGRAARHASAPVDRQLWSALYELEAQTRAAVFDRLGAEVHTFRAGQRLAMGAGVAGGIAMPWLPRRLQLHSVVSGAQPFMRHFQRLDAYFAGTPQASFFGYVLAHERAIIELGKRALAGQDNAGGAVEALLGHVPD